MGDDWDTPSQPNASGGGFGGGTGFGRGRGFGGGDLNKKMENVSVGGGGGDGWGGSTKADDGWGSSSKTENGWGSSGTKADEWGSGGGTTDGGGKSDGWGSSNGGGGFGAGGSGGGFGGGGGSGRGGGGRAGGGRGCFKCGEEGHMSRECPTGGGGGGRGRGCFKCGEEGHMSRECPSGGGGGGAGRGCFKCGEEGHMSRECPSGGGGGGAGRGCFKCGEEGHMSRECPSGGGGGGGGRGRGCFKCGEEGHMSRECPSGGGGGGGGRGCFKCGEEGHMSRECPSGGGGGGGGRGCFKCGEEGHMSRECPQGGGDSRPKGCFNCGEEGHNSRDCPEPLKTRTMEPGEDGKPREIYVPKETAEDSLYKDGISSGINFSKYQHIPCRVTGNNICDPINSFEDSGLRPILRDNVKKSGYTTPTPVQRYAIPIVMKGRDLMACAQTGSGKTAAFLLPVIHTLLEENVPAASFDPCQNPYCVVVSPTRELAMQIYNEARKFANTSVIKAVVAYGGTSVQHQSNVLQRGCHILVATPGRLLDFVEKGKVAFANLKFIVLDEADRMLDMGFQGDIDRMINHPTMPAKAERHTLMFSATFPDAIQRLAASYLQDYLFLMVGVVGAASTDVTQTFVEVSHREKRDKLESVLRDIGGAKTLVFVEAKRVADFIASHLCQVGFPTTSIHGDRLQREREEALADFKYGKTPTLIATSVASRGLDIKGVANVVNYDLPKSIDDYVHRIGRTGRVGNTGNAISFYDGSRDSALAADLVKILAGAEQEVPEFLQRDAGSSDFGGSGGGSFASRDIRRGVGGSAGGGGGYNQSSAALEEEESWD